MVCMCVSVIEWRMYLRCMTSVNDLCVLVHNISGLLLRPTSPLMSATTARRKSE